MPVNVLIAGGGPAALEAALTLHRLAGERVNTTLLAPASDLTYRRELAGYLEGLDAERVAGRTIDLAVR